MHSVSDFKVIMPAFAQLLTAAYEQMTRNDYLLTAAILCQVYRLDSTVNASANIAPLKFDRYTRSAASGGMYDTNEEIFLDGTKIATWLYHYNLYTINHRCQLGTLPNAERIIFAALGLTDSDYQEYTAQEKTRRASLLVGYESGAPLPKLEIVSFNL
jgi:hypothetical protein